VLTAADQLHQFINTGRYMTDRSLYQQTRLIKQSFNLLSWSSGDLQTKASWQERSTHTNTHTYLITDVSMKRWHIKWPEQAACQKFISRLLSGSRPSIMLAI